MKVAIITINIGQNYGNRLQNYALSNFLLKLGVKNDTLKYKEERKKSDSIKKFIKKTVFYNKYKNQLTKEQNFKEFNKLISFSKTKISNTYIPTKELEDYDYFIAGSDQIWNLYFPENSIVHFLGFTQSNKKITYAPSFGTSTIPDNVPKEISQWINDIPYLSVREDKGKNIIKELTGRDDAVVLIDPTMLLTSKEWDKVAKKPKDLKDEKFILNYFLGEISDERKKEIQRIADENKCKIINILDKNDPFYTSGPSEFLYLEKNAFLICTDSFHSSVFALLYDRPFIVFEREQKGLESMNSRIDTLISKFQLTNRKFIGKITKENLEHDYTKAYKILENEREKSASFLKSALKLGDNE